MNKLSVKSLFHNYEALFSNDVNSLFPEAVQERRFHVLIDAHVAKLHGERLRFLGDAASIIEVQPVESKKDLPTAMDICQQLLESHITKSDYIVVIGGGLTQDLGAFCAHVLKRGIPWIFIPTTLLAMCDSCIGSKYGINMASFKNQVGGFCPPASILVDTSFLHTLEEMDVYNGLGEIVKVHIIAGQEDVAVLAEASREDLVTHRDELLPFIFRSLEIKKEIVEKDEFDLDYRHILNYGHTFGHAIESYTDNEIPHGIAVAIGMDIANYISEKKGFITGAQYEQLSQLIRAYIPHKQLAFSDLPRMQESLKQDKKFDGEQLTALLCKGAGNVVQCKVEVNDELAGMIDACFQVHAT